MSAKSILQKIKRVFGLSQPAGTEAESAGETQADVTVEREPDSGGGGASASAAGTTVESDAAAGGTGTDTETGPAGDHSPPEAGIEDDSEPEVADDQPDAAGESVDAIKGIGPTYSDRLSDAGIETIGDLADAEAAAVAEAAKTGETKAGSWIERARNRLS